MELNDKQLQLLDFIKHCHVGQFRKYTNEPYWMHPLAVAELVSDLPGDFLVEIALLHDVVEDTHVTIDVICDHLEMIGYNKLEVRAIERGVIALTDVYTSEKFDHMNRKTRKEFEAHRLGKIHGDFQTVKYADLIDNTNSIVEHDPGFAKVYIAEKRYMLNLMRNGNMDLFVDCYNSLLKAEKQLNHANTI